MYIVPIAWLYVAFMMAVAEATNSTGSVLGAVVTFVLYGLVPVLLVVYLMGTPARKRAIKARELNEMMHQREAEMRDPQKPVVDVVLAAPHNESQAHADAPANSTEPNAGSHAATATQSGGIAPVRKEA
jgi:Na+-transporting methylmalonyl-CoA/oxaloacetate decarboxylase gamma subunit